jgi:flavin reductase (DIM6/NTAB) family NADH-FMN oxidoreductase RutF
MQFDFDNMAAADRSELLLGTVVPRPIALITTLVPDGAINAAPYSLFNVMGYDPAVVMVSVLTHPEGRFKDTANNIFATKKFVISLVSESVAEAMNVTCIDAPPGRNELELARLNTVASFKVKPPRVSKSPVAFEAAGNHCDPKGLCDCTRREYFTAISWDRASPLSAFESPIDGGCR